MAKIDISKKDKAAVLVALYNKAMNSRVAASHAPTMYGTPVAEPEFTYEDAQALLEVNSNVEVIGSVFIGIDFSGDTIDSRRFDQAHSNVQDHNDKTSRQIIKTIPDVPQEPPSCLIL